MTSTQISCLCLGPKQSGKTHLLTSLQVPGSVTNVSHSVPTIGTNIFQIKLPEKFSTVKSTIQANETVAKHRKPSSSTSKSSRNREITVLEIGGSMAPMWKNYLSNVTKIIYVVDTSNLCQISAAGQTCNSNIINLIKCIFNLQVSYYTHYLLILDYNAQRFYLC